MKGVQKIKDTIKKDADTQIKHIKAAAKSEADAIVKEEQSRLDLESKQHKERTKLLVENLEHSTLAKARLDARKELLNKREQIIIEITGKAADSIDHKSKSYHALLKTLVDECEAALGKKLTIRCAKEDLATVKKLSSGKVEEATIAGGIVAEGSNGKRIDRSLAIILEEKQSEIRRAVAAALD